MQQKGDKNDETAASTESSQQTNFDYMFDFKTYSTRSTSVSGEYFAQYTLEEDLKKFHQCQQHQLFDEEETFQSDGLLKEE